MRGARTSARSNPIGFGESSVGWVQRRLDSYVLESALSGALVTVTRDPLGSNVHRSESPASTPRTSTTVDGTVVRNESERSIAFTSLDSIGLGTGSSLVQRAGVKERVGLHVRQHVGSNLKYSHAVGQHVGRHMATDSGRMTVREIRALEMLRDGHRVAESPIPGRYIVGSQSGKGLYQVDGVGIPDTFESCTCPDFDERTAPCKHIYLVRQWIRASRIPPSSSEAPFRTPPPKRAPINWRVYNQAQCEEKRLFLTLLSDLSKGFPEPFRDPHMAGQKPIPLRDQVFCAVQKAYLGFSCRGSQEFQKEAARRGQLETEWFWAVSSRFLCREDVTGGLHDMLARSALPLIGLEDRCAIDSTGLRTTRFHYYRKEKYEPSRENDWRKLHALVGVKTHVIPVLEVTDGSANDSPQFSVLLRRAAANGFNFKEVYADKAYSSRNNSAAAAELEILPFIPPKRNETGKSKGVPMYHKMFLFFQYHREEYDIHYGQRAQVESAFGAFKQKLGETLASRNFTAQTNEIICRAIAFNVMVLVRQMFEVGILPDFLRPPATTGPEFRVPSPDVATPILASNHPDGAVPVTESNMWRDACN